MIALRPATTKRPCGAIAEELCEILADAHDGADAGVQQLVAAFGPAVLGGGIVDDPGCPGPKCVLAGPLVVPPQQLSERSGAPEASGVCRCAVHPVQGDGTLKIPSALAGMQPRGETTEPLQEIREVGTVQDEVLELFGHGVIKPRGSRLDRTVRRADAGTFPVEMDEIVVDVDLPRFPRVGGAPTPF